MDYYIRTRGDLERMIAEVGIVPFFRNRVPGWSVEEHIDRAVWFTDQDGPWEWKGPLAFEKKCAYGKLIRNKTAFVSLDCFPDLANWRRDGYDFDARLDEGLVSRREKLLMEWLCAHPCSLSSEAKRGCGFSEGYDTVLTRLEMQTYVLNADFRYSVDRHGRPYGWGSAVLCAADDWLDADQLAAPAGRAPAESFERLFDRLRAAMPEADEAALRRELR
ncbi:MAG: hypothetical protein IKS52_13440 [Clostridia bacterium]|nr:hypothetical protein [Clostridia bacterium]MBR4444260.1 hypothetical protein [Clostridia bacterium]